VVIADKEQAARDAAEPAMGEWGLEAKLLYFGHLCWLLQEVCWILLFSYPAIVFGFLSTTLVAIVLYRRRDGGVSGRLYNEAGAEVLVNIIQLGWVGFSFIDCIADFGFYYRADEDTPGYAKGLVNLCSGDKTSCGNTFDTLTVVVQVGFGITFGIWIISCCYLLFLWVRPPVFVAQGYEFQTCLLEGGWIAFWVLMDIASSFDDEGFPYALVAYCIHFVLLACSLVVKASNKQITLWNGLDAQEMEALGDVVCRVDVVILSYILWSLSSLVWLLMEHAFDEDEGWRWVAGGTAMVAVVLFLAGYKQAMQRGMLLKALTDVHLATEQERCKTAPEEIVVGSSERVIP